MKLVTNTVTTLVILLCGHCNRRVRPTSDRKRKIGVNKLFTAVNGDIYDGP